MTVPKARADGKIVSAEMEAGGRPVHPLSR